MTKKIYSFRLSEDLISRVDAVGGSRSEFVRAAIEVALDVLDASVAISDITPNDILDDLPMKPSPSKNLDVGSSGRTPLPDASPRNQDKADLLTLIGSGRYSSRQAKDHLGWLGLRYENAERALLSGGSVVVIDGLLVAT